MPPSTSDVQQGLHGQSRLTVLADKIHAAINISPPDDDDDIFSYGIVLDRTGGDRLGINLSSPDGDAVVINGISADGLVGMWNRLNPDNEVSHGDRIVQVNGVPVTLHTLLQQCEADDILYVTLHGSRERRPHALEQAVAVGHAQEEPMSDQQDEEAKPNHDFLRKHSGHSAVTAECEHVEGIDDSEEAEAQHYGSVEQDQLIQAEETVSSLPSGDEHTDATPSAMDGHDDARGRLDYDGQDVAQSLPAGGEVLYSIVLDRTGGDRLGINLGSPDGQMVIISGIAEEGLVGMWNTNNPDNQVCVGDFITEVNRVPVTARTLLRQCEADDILYMTLQSCATAPISSPAEEPIVRASPNVEEIMARSGLPADEIMEHICSLGESGTSHADSLGERVVVRGSSSTTDDDDVMSCSNARKIISRENSRLSEEQDRVSSSVDPAMFAQDRQVENPALQDGGPDEESSHSKQGSTSSNGGIGRPRTSLKYSEVQSTGYGQARKKSSIVAKKGSLVSNGNAAAGDLETETGTESNKVLRFQAHHESVEMEQPSTLRLDDDEPQDVRPAEETTKLRFEAELQEVGAEDDGQGSDVSSAESEVWDNKRVSVAVIASRKSLAGMAGNTLVAMARTTLKKDVVKERQSNFSSTMSGVADPKKARHPARAKQGKKLLNDLRGTDRESFLERSGHQEGDRIEVTSDKESLQVVRSQFFDSMPEAYITIESIDQVINPRLLRRFLKQVQTKGGSVEATFHGTPVKYSAAILREGLLKDLTTTAAYGHGAYVGAHAGVAHQYADPNKEQLRAMCVVLVNIGSLVKGKQGVESDVTATDRVVNPTQYCFVDESRMMVSHILTYKVTGGQRRRIGGGWHDPFERKLNEAIQKAARDERRGGTL